MTAGSSPATELTGESPLVAAPADGLPATGPQTPVASSPADVPDEVFARAVGLDQDPRQGGRTRRRRGGPRPTVTAEDAERLAAAAQPGVTRASQTWAADARPARSGSWLSRRRARVRRTRRTIRHIDPWSVFKVSLLLYICLYIAAMIAGVLLWSAAVNSGLIGNVEAFITKIGSYEVWQLNGEEIFRRVSVIGLVLMVTGVAFNVLMAIVFNLISDLVGGVRVTILEEDSAPRPTI